MIADYADHLRQTLPGDWTTTPKGYTILDVAGCAVVVSHAVFGPGDEARRIYAYDAPEDSLRLVGERGVENDIAPEVEDAVVECVCRAIDGGRAVRAGDVPAWAQDAVRWAYDDVKRGWRRDTVTKTGAPWALYEALAEEIGPRRRDDL